MATEMTAQKWADILSGKWSDNSKAILQCFKAAGRPVTLVGLQAAVPGFRIQMLDSINNSLPQRFGCQITHAEGKKFEVVTI